MRQILLLPVLVSLLAACSTAAAKTAVSESGDGGQIQAMTVSSSNRQDACSPGTSFQSSSSQSVSTGPAPTVVVQSSGANVMVTVGTDNNIRVRSQSCGASQNEVNSTSLNVSSQNDAVQVTASSASSQPATLTIQVPPGATLQVNSMNGNIDLQGMLQSSSSLHTTAGNITVTIPDTSNLTVAASTTSGQIRNDFALQVDGSGPVTLNGAIGSGTDASLDLATGNGDIAILNAGS